MEVIGQDANGLEQKRQAPARALNAVRNSATCSTGSAERRSRKVTAKQYIPPAMRLRRYWTTGIYPQYPGFRCASPRLQLLQLPRMSFGLCAGYARGLQAFCVSQCIHSIPRWR
jgi:hypothetical protein